MQSLRAGSLDYVFDRLRALRYAACAVFALLALSGCVSRERGVAYARAQPVALLSPRPAPRTPLYLEVWPTVHGTAAGPLFPHMGLHSGDRIGLQARTSRAAHVYLIHCDGSDLLSVFPAAGPIQFPADERVALPAVGQDLRLTDAPGAEALYIVASQEPLDRSDPRLEAALARARESDGLHGCGSKLEALLIGSSEHARRAHARRSIAPEREREREQKQGALRGIEGSQAYPSVARAFSEEDGVIVLRFRYRHLP